MQTFDDNLGKYLQEKLDLFNNNNRTEFTVIIIGPTGSGKSTLSNGLINENLFFENNGTFIPKQKNTFEIGRDLAQSNTKDPQFHQINQEFSLWDIPGFGDSRSVNIDIKTNIFSNILFNSGQKILILLLIQISQIVQGKCSQIVEILNMIKDSNVSILLIITKTEKKHKIHDVISILKKLINNEETKMENSAKILLQEIIDKQQVVLIQRPKPTTNDPKIFELDKQDFEQIFQKVFNQDIYKQSNFTIQHSKESKEYFDQQIQKYKDQFQQQLKFLLKLQSSLKILQISFQDNKNKMFQKITDNILEQQKLLGNIIQAYNKVAKQIQHAELTPNEYIDNYKSIDKLFTSGIKDEIQGQELYIKGLQITSSQVMIIYNEYKDRNIIVITIYIYSQQGFCIDQDLILPGINLFIQTKEFYVKLQSQINLKGNKGKPHIKAQIENNEIPQSLKGEPGQNGGSLYIEAKTANNLELLTINLSGGDGGDGQDGADGENGTDGKDGDYEMVKNKDEKCDFHYEEEPFDLTQVFLTFNRSFKCFYKSSGKCGTKGGNSRQGGIGGCVGQKGILKSSQEAILNLVDLQSEVGQKGQDGQPGRGGKMGRDYVGVEQQIKVFGRTRDLKNLEKKQDNVVAGTAGNLATEVVGTAVGVAIVQGLKVAAEESAALSLGQVLKGAVIGVTSAASFAVTLGLQIVGTGIQILHSDQKWLEEPHPVDNNEYEQSGEVMDNDHIIEQIDIDAQIQQQRQEFQQRIENFAQFQQNFKEQIRKDYPIQELHESLFGEDYQMTAK